MPNAPRHQTMADVEYVAGDHWAVGVAVDSQSRSYVDATDLVRIDAYALVHPRVTKQWKASRANGQLMAIVRNVFGTEYIAFTEPDPDGNSYQPGPTRELFVGVRVDIR